MTLRERRRLLDTLPPLCLCASAATPRACACWGLTRPRAQADTAAVATVTAAAGAVATVTAAAPQEVGTVRTASLRARVSLVSCAGGGGGGQLGLNQRLGFFESASRLLAPPFRIVWFRHTFLVIL